MPEVAVAVAGPSAIPADMIARIVDVLHPEQVWLFGSRARRSSRPRVSSSMAADAPKPDPRVIAASLDDVDHELDAAHRLIADPPNRFAAFHSEQAAEKLDREAREDFIPRASS